MKRSVGKYLLTEYLELHVASFEHAVVQFREREKEWRVSSRPILSQFDMHKIRRLCNLRGSEMSMHGFLRL